MLSTITLKVTLSVVLESINTTRHPSNKSVGLVGNVHFAQQLVDVVVFLVRVRVPYRLAALDKWLLVLLLRRFRVDLEPNNDLSMVAKSLSYRMHDEIRFFDKKSVKIIKNEIFFFTPLNASATLYYPHHCIALISLFSILNVPLI